MQEYYAAPMEGLTGWRWRQVQSELFGGADRYYTPFLSPNANFEFQTKELQEIDPEHNRDLLWCRKSLPIGRNTSFGRLKSARAGATAR